MPTTYNGIGTHYYGRKNLSVRPGMCRHCRRNVNLSSYDTRLWFVIVFIPVIPLGRKRIIDACPACTRHMAVEADQWETTSQLEVSGALAKFRAGPTPELGLAAHAALLGFHRFPEAETFRTELSALYPDSAEVQACLGMALDGIGQQTAALPFFERALDLRPEHPGARMGVAGARIAQGRLDEARKLIDFLDKPGAGQVHPLAILETLALAYQKSGNHTAALELFGRLQSELPKIAEHGIFRKAVVTSEKALGRSQSLLPKRAFTWAGFLGITESIDGSHQRRRMVSLAAVAAVAVFGGLCLRCLYVGQHRVIQVVNAFPAEVTLAVREIAGDRVVIPSVHGPPGRSEFVVPEGRYRIVMGGATEDVAELSVSSSFWSRLGGDPVWVLNPGGRAILLAKEVVYSRNPRPGTEDFRVGGTVEYFERITHPFRETPASVSMKSSEGERVYVQLEQVDAELPAVMNHLVASGRTGEALSMAEGWLTRRPRDESVLESYGALATRREQLERARRFLRAGLNRRPVEVEWHRLFQTVAGEGSGAEEVAALYDAAIRAEPDNSALQYLRGRIERSGGRSIPYFERAIQLDPSNSWPWFALGYGHVQMHQWKPALQRLERAAALRPEDGHFEELLLQAATGAADDGFIRERCQRVLGTNPVSVLHAFTLAGLLQRTGRTNEAAARLATLENELGRREPRQAGRSKMFVRNRRAYIQGELATVEKAAQDLGEGGARMLVLTQIERGELARARAHPGYGKMTEQEPWFALAAAVASREAGDIGEADRLTMAAVKVLTGGERGTHSALQSLVTNEPPTVAVVLHEVGPLSAQAIVFTALSQKYPERRAEFQTAAREANVEPQFPFHLIRRVAGSAEK